MKKIILLGITILGYVCISNAQEIADNAIGLRFGDSDGFGAEVSYQKGLSDSNRLEFDLGWRDGKGYDGIKLTGLYQKVWNIEGGFNWYAGAGGGLASYSFDSDLIDNETFIYVAGDIGIEYNFPVPLLVSLDFRPELGFGEYNDDIDFDIALGIRYQF